MSLYLPSKKKVTTWFFLALIACAAGISLWVMLKEQVKDLAPAKSNIVINPNLAIINQVANQDTDGDGLKDWEEVLWKTDPHNPDTDGDGTSDGDEVKVGRDPLKAGPNDKLDTSTIITGTATTNLTQTDIFSRQLFAEYLKLQQQDGGQISDANQQYLVDTYLSKVPEAEPVKIYARADIKVVKGDTAADYKIYANAVGKVLRNNRATGIENELVIFKRALDNKDRGELRKIDVIIAGDASTLKGLLTVSVPESLLAQHLDIINSYQASDESIRGLREVFDDPVVAIANLSAYNKRTGLLKESLQSMINIFVQKGIIFSTSDDGYFFIHII
jgi:hypothetical protein